MTTTSIALAKLVLSPLNVRQTTAADPTEDLEASILEHGLLAPLVAHPMGRGKFGIIAGGRRLRAMNALAERGAIDAKTWMVDVTIRDEDAATATELSTVENTARVALPAATEFRAFARLAEAGADIAAIAGRFATTELHVRQRMRLGQLHPDILEALEAGRITLDIAKVYASTTDQDLQRRVFDQRPAHAFEIRAALKRDLSSAGVDRMMQLVTVETYAAAGGRSEEDLFVQDEYRVLDVDLLRKLYDAKLEQERAAIGLPDSVTLQFTAEGVGPRVEIGEEPTEAEQERQLALDARADEINGRLEDIADWDMDGPAPRMVADPGNDQQEVDNLVAELKRVEEEADAISRRAQIWPDGPVIAIARIEGGRLLVTGYHRPYGLAAAPIGGVASTTTSRAEMAAALGLKGASPAASVARPAAIDAPKRVASVWEADRQTNGTVLQPEAVARDEFGLSRDAAEVMRSYRRLALSAILLDGAAHRRIAEDYLLFVLVRGVAGDATAVELGVHSLPRHDYDPPMAREDLAAQPGTADVKETRDRVLAFEWMREPDLSKAFALYVDATQAEKTEASAYVAVTMLARTMNAPGYRPDNRRAVTTDIHDRLASMCDADPAAIRQVWTPTEQYFERLPKARRIEAIQAVAPSVEKRLANLSNGELTTAAVDIMSGLEPFGAKYGVLTQERWAAAGWIPEYMAFRDPDDPGRLLGDPPAFAQGEAA